MKHYTASVQCGQCGYRFEVCVHYLRLVATGKGFTISCPDNASRVYVPVAALVSADVCPPGAVVVNDDWRRRG